MSDQKYNGWTNRATWLVSIWYNPETKVDVQYIKEALEEEVENLSNGMLKDLIDLDAINWDELIENCEEEVTEDENN